MPSAILRFLAVSVTLLVAPAVAAGESQSTPPDPALVAKGLQLQRHQPIG
jgi:hypothetical protein